MALIERFHVLASHFPVAAGQQIIRGMAVALNSSGEVIIADNTGTPCIGIAGDTKSTSLSGLADTNNSSVGPWQTRVSDGFDETKASGRMTVYMAGGVFATNEFMPGVYNVSDLLYVGTGANAGLLATAAILGGAAGNVVGIVTRSVPGGGQPEDSGVPGTDVNGSLSLGSYLEFKLFL